MRATAEIVSCLVRTQCPEFGGLEVRAVEVDGWDNATFRLGQFLSVRLPSDDAYTAQVDKEHRWLPVLAAHLPVPIPSPVFRGDPGCGFPRPWSVYRWIDGSPAAGVSTPELADELAAFLLALRGVPAAGGPVAGPHSFGRGGPVAQWDVETRALIDDLGPAAALPVWEAATLARYDGPAVWVHGDVTGSNLLVDGGRLVGVIDFGCAAVGDPACDLVAAWTMFAGEARRHFVSQMGDDSGTWARARGWALWKALISVRSGGDMRSGARFGWSRSANEVIAEIVKESL